MRRPSPRSARPFARALFDVALPEGDPGAVAEDLRLAAGLLASQPELRDALGHPALPTERKKALWAAVWSAAHGGALTGRLLGLLIDRGKAALLPAIEEAFRELWNSHRKVVAAEAVSATPLDAAQQSALMGAIRETTGLDVELKTRVDPALLGGLVVRMGGRTYDGSVSSRLKALRERLGHGRADA